jgi:hypothetical protein
MTENVIEFIPREEREELAEMRQSLLKVSDDRDAMARVAFLAERIADMLGEMDGISVPDRISLQWHLSLIWELAAPRSGGKLKPLCRLPRFDRDDPPDGAA